MTTNLKISLIIHGLNFVEGKIVQIKTIFGDYNIIINIL